MGKMFVKQSLLIRRTSERPHHFWRGGPDGPEQNKADAVLEVLLDYEINHIEESLIVLGFFGGPFEAPDEPII
jgi:hypothetical protein